MSAIEDGQGAKGSSVSSRAIPVVVWTVMGLTLLCAIAAVLVPTLVLNDQLATVENNQQAMINKLNNVSSAVGTGSVLSIPGMSTSGKNCTIRGVSVKLVGKAAAPIGIAGTPYNATNPSTTPYDEAAVLAHVVNDPYYTYKSPLTHNFACVDARGDEPIQGTPGGDFSELAIGVAVYFNFTKQDVTEASVAAIFNKYMQDYVTPARPFYFHNDDGKLRKLLGSVGDAGVTPRPVVFPLTMPTNNTEAEIWLQKLVKPDYNGCGHVRLTLANATLYGLPNENVPKYLLEAFYNYWWPTPLGSPQRAKVDYVIQQGALMGGAVTIVNNTGPGCDGYHPAVDPYHDGSAVFVFHAHAVATWREQVLTPFFRTIDPKIDAAQFTAEMSRLAGVQLGQTLTLLDPANRIDIFAVDVATAPAAA